jgi:transcriptional regulator with XRE-family HTH domain
MLLKDRVLEAIDKSEKTKAEIARACSVTNAAVTHWISGDTKNMKADTALALEEATGYRARWILYGKGTKKVGAPYWPFTQELLDAVKKLESTDLDRLENAMRLHLRLELLEKEQPQKLDRRNDPRISENLRGSDSKPAPATKGVRGN